MSSVRRYGHCFGEYAPLEAATTFACHLSIDDKATINLRDDLVILLPLCLLISAALKWLSCSIPLYHNTAGLQCTGSSQPQHIYTYEIVRATMTIGFCSFGTRVPLYVLTS